MVWCTVKKTDSFECAHVLKKLISEIKSHICVNEFWILTFLMENLTEKLIKNLFNLLRLFVLQWFCPCLLTMMVYDIQNIIVPTAFFLHVFLHNKQIYLKPIQRILFIQNNSWLFGTPLWYLVSLELANLALKHEVFKVDFAVWEPIPFLEVLVACSSSFVELAVDCVENCQIMLFLWDLPPAMSTHSSKHPKFVFWIIQW